MAADPQEDWMGKLKLCMSSAGSTMLEGVQSASAMWQEQLDGMGPTCSCKRVCDKSQWIVPVVITEDDVPYPYSHGACSSTASPMSPRQLLLREGAAKPMSFDPSAVFPVRLATPTRESRFASPADMALLTPTCHAAQAVPRDRDGPSQPNFGYWAEYSPVLRPPSTVGSNSIVNTGVRAAPWAHWENAGRSRAAKASAGGLSHAANALRALRDEARFEAEVAAAAARPNVQPSWAPQSAAPPWGSAATPAASSTATPHGRTSPLAATAPATASRMDKLASRACAEEQTNTRAWQTGAAENIGPPWAAPVAAAVVTEERQRGFTATLADPWAGPLAAPMRQNAVETEKQGLIDTTAPSWIEAATDTSAKEVDDQQARYVGVEKSATAIALQPEARADTDEKAQGSQKQEAGPRAEDFFLDDADDLEDEAVDRVPSLPNLKLAAAQKKHEKKPDKAKSEAKSVLSGSSSLKSSVADTLGQAAEGSSSGVLKRRPNASRQSDADRKSTLSASASMKSSAALTLGSLAKPSGSRRGKSSERGSTESVVGGVTTAAPRSRSSEAKVRTEALAEATDAAAEKDAAPTPSVASSSNAGSRSVASSRPRQSRSKGPDAKSVISGLNASGSSASALLGPMLGQQPKKRTAKPDGADLASVL